jgi:2-hydroxycyclohexanecarboxyl-CoA dehydrogenase
MENNQKVAIITGGAAGIGKACALRFVEEGMRVVIGDISEDIGVQTRDLIQDQGGEALFVPGSIAYKDVCRELADTAMNNWGRIDILVANAAARNFTRFVETSDEEWDSLLAVNLKGTAQSCQAVLPTMVEQKSGIIVLMSSVHYLEGRTEMPIYDATKAGIVSMTRSLAIEYGPNNIRVNAVCPGLTITDFHINKAKQEGRELSELQEMEFGALKRTAKPSEIAGAVYFLTSDDSSSVTGHALMVDGGFSAGV